MDFNRFLRFGRFVDRLKNHHIPMTLNSVGLGGLSTLNSGGEGVDLQCKLVDDFKCLFDPASAYLSRQPELFFERERGG